MKKMMLIISLALVLTFVLAVPVFAATSHASINSATGTYANGNPVSASSAGQGSGINDSSSVSTMNGNLRRHSDGAVVPASNFSAAPGHTGLGSAVSLMGSGKYKVFITFGTGPCKGEGWGDFY